MSLSDIGSVASILSFFATGILAYYTNQVRKKFQRAMRFEQLKANKKSLIDELKSSRDILKDEDLYEDLINNAEISEVIRRLVDYKSHMRLKDRWALIRCRRLIKRKITEQNKVLLITHISTLIGFLKSQLDIDIKNV